MAILHKITLGDIWLCQVDASPDGSITAPDGSFALDPSTGSIYVNRGGSTSWLGFDMSTPETVAITNPNNAGTTTRFTASDRLEVEHLVLNSTGTNTGGANYSVLVAGQTYITAMLADLNVAGRQAFYAGPVVMEAGETIQTIATGGGGQNQTNILSFRWRPINSGAMLS